MPGFRFKRSESSVAADHPRAETQLAASLSIKDGDALVIANAKLAKATSSTTKVDFIAGQDATSGATDIVRPMVYKAAIGVYEIGFTPLKDAVVCSAGSTTTATFPDTVLTLNQLQYGLMYLHATKETRVISASTLNNGTSVTATVIEPFSKAIASGDKVTIIPFGIGGDPKLLTENTIDTAVANKTGGPLNVTTVDMAGRKASVKFK